MLNETPIKSRTIFLLQFTTELIRNSKSTEMFRLEEIVRKRLGLPSPPIQEIKKIPKEEIAEKIKEHLSKKPIENLKEEIKSPLPQRVIPPIPEQKKVMLRIPEQNLPNRLQHIKPTIDSERLNLGKLDVLINDPNVEAIECEGNDKKIIVNGKMGRRLTGIALTKQEIDQVLNEFFIVTKIPLTKGINKFAAGNLVITAIVSEDESHFIIKKIKESPLQVPRPPSQNYY